MHKTIFIKQSCFEWKNTTLLTVSKCSCKTVLLFFVKPLQLMVDDNAAVHFHKHLSLIDEHASGQPAWRACSMTVVDMLLMYEDSISKHLTFTKT